MHVNSEVREFVLGEENFFSFYREIAAYGELEGVDNRSLIQKVGVRLAELEERVLEFYSRSGIDLDQELEVLFAGNSTDSSAEDLEKSATELTQLSPANGPNDRHLDGQLSSIDRRRGVTPRTNIKNLESRWLNTLKTYLRLLKHCENLPGTDKINHLTKALESGELFVKALASKREIIARCPAVVIDGILYINMLALIDPEKSLAEFRYGAPMSFADLLSDILSNPKLSPAFRQIIGDGSQMVKYFIRRMLLEHASLENAECYVRSMTETTQSVLITSSLRELRDDYVVESYKRESKDYLDGILKRIAESQELRHLISKKRLEKLRLVELMHKNASKE